MNQPIPVSGSDKTKDYSVSVHGVYDTTTDVVTITHEKVDESTDSVLRKLLVLSEIRDTPAFRPFLNLAALESEIDRLENEWRDEALWILERNLEADKRNAENCGPAS